MSEKRFVCIDVDYGDDWYITDNGKRLSEMEIVDLLNRQQISIETMLENMEKLEKENEQLRKELDNFKPVIFQDARKGTVILYSKVI